MRNGIDTVEISRIEKLLADLDTEGLRRFFSEEELADAGGGGGRAQKLAARFAAKEACCKLFPKEICLGTIEPHDFSLSRDGYGQPHVLPSERARAVMNRHRVAAISVSTTHTETSATAVASIEPSTMAVPWYGKLIYRVLPLRRRVVMENLRRVYGDTLTDRRITEIAQAFYGHLVKFLGEFVRLAFMSAAKKEKFVRIEGIEHLAAAREQGKGVLLLAGHFGNWEVSTVAGMSHLRRLKSMKRYFCL
jgi:phosphopantetheine--protein transferase-like protein